MTTTSDRLHRGLKQDIITCTLAPGTPFSEGEIARRYKASRTPVREACRRLQQQGLVAIVPRRGYFVAPLTLSEFHSLQELELIVEPAVASLAALRATPAQLDAIQAAADYEYRIAAKATYYAFLERNFNLHVGIAQATQNLQLLQVVTDVQTRLMRFYYLIISMASYGQELVREHRALVTAIRGRKPELAGQRAREHVTNTIRRSAGMFLEATESRLNGLITEASDWTPQGTPGGVPGAALKPESI